MLYHPREIAYLTFELARRTLVFETSTLGNRYY